ncbi:hypothetical protein BLNAU_11848 [Blattamonas nauphoetae]|uniref:Uncharacterized protein n=1 Tax=Blattamonas nauphoetae TaxID=2049346 RepID=A0ABQ9XPA7_9EUKA|nr:hypothetical protein BLNAU_11848 [Blattamonas nauphoetae]
MPVNRTEGKGSAAIDARNPQSLTIHASFCHCHSVQGVAGALTIDSSEVPFDGEFEVLMIGNRGKDDETAHDIFISGVTPDAMSTSSFSSCSDQPRIQTNNNIEIPFQRINNLLVVEDDVIADVTTSGNHTISVQSLESTDLSVLMNQSSFTLSFSTSAQRVLVISPFHIQSGRVTIQSVTFVKTILTQSNKTDETLFKLSSNDRANISLMISYVRVLLNTQHTAPMITVDPQSSFHLSRSVVSSDGGVSRRPFVRSEGTISFAIVSFIDMSFDGCSCIETTGGKMTFEGAFDLGDSGVYSLSTNVDGAFLNAVGTRVQCSKSIFVDCHAKNGGAIFAKDYTLVNLSSFFIDCSAEERGGGVCSEYSSSLSQSPYFDITSNFVNCHAKFGGGIFLTLTKKMDAFIESNVEYPFLGQPLSFPLFEGCSAEKGAGGYFDGQAPSMMNIRFDGTINDGPVCPGTEFFVSQSLAKSIVEKGRLVSQYFQSDGSLSSRSENDDGPSKHVEVEGYPEYSYNFELPNIVVDDDESTFDLDGCIQISFTSSCNSLSHLVDRFHTQTDNGRFLQVPIGLQNKLFLFETARVTHQSIKLIIGSSEEHPPERTQIAFGDNPNSDTTVFLVVDTSGSVELSELTVDWEVNLALCQLIDRTASMSILGSEIKIASVISFPLVACEAGTLVISDSSFSSTTSDTFNHPLVLSGMSTSCASNSAQSEMIVEMSGVKFNDLKMKDEVGVIELNDVDCIKISHPDFDNVTLSSGKQAVRIMVRGRDLWKTIDPAAFSGFPQRGTPEMDHLYQSLDRNLEVGPFHTPTLLVYLTTSLTVTVHVQSNGRDVLGCGDAVLSCFSLDEADSHLEVGFPSVITIIDSAQLSSQLDLVQDQTKISAKGSTCSIEVAATGSLINHKTGSVDHILELVHLSFVLSSGRSKALLQSTSGTLIVTDCSFSWNSELESELTLIVGGRMRLIDVNMTRVESSIPLFRFVGDGTTQPTASIENCHFSSSSSSLTRSTNKDENDDSDICWWNSSLILVSKSNLDVSSSSFSDDENGGIVVVNGTMSVYDTRFEQSLKEGSGSVNRFGSLNRNILCSVGSLILLKSTSVETAVSTSLWINADSSCVVRDSADLVISNPFFVPSLIGSSCSASFDKKSSKYLVNVVGKELIPCGLSLIVRENTTSGTPSSVPFGMDRLEFVDETNVSVSISNSELSKLDSKLGWIGLVGFGVDGETNPFTFKVDAKQARAELMKKTLPWLIPLIVVVVLAIIVVIILVVVCRRRRLAKNGPKTNEMKDETVPVEEQPVVENECAPETSQPPQTVTADENAVEVETNTAKVEPIQSDS